MNSPAEDLAAENNYGGVEALGKSSRKMVSAGGLDSATRVNCQLVLGGLGGFPFGSACLNQPKVPISPAKAPSTAQPRSLIPGSCSCEGSSTAHSPKSHSPISPVAPAKAPSTAKSPTAHSCFSYFSGEGSVDCSTSKAHSLFLQLHRQLQQWLIRLSPLFPHPRTLLLTHRLCLRPKLQQRPQLNILLRHPHKLSKIIPCYSSKALTIYPEKPPKSTPASPAPEKTPPSSPTPSDNNMAPAPSPSAATVVTVTSVMSTLFTVAFTVSMFV
ncbi:hypothetical protein Bca52824_022080 [Brassica carinata]|uniref:Uncharacterized protein n=1 Tax=Brassica carinata TaxID=52824 RepID=A0A8X8ASV2_BRACI|nr:hypothetical protein Bca52824_022080 [Brassica carinata]